MSEEKCYKCGCVQSEDGDELRPYGPQGQWVCFDCAMGSDEGRASASEIFSAQLNLSESSVLTDVGPVPFSKERLQ